VRMASVAALAAAVALTVTGCLTPLRAPVPLTPVPAPVSPLVGVYEPGSPNSWTPVAEFAATTGVQPRVAVYYSDWNNPFSTSFALEAWRHDAYVLVQIQPKGVTLASVAAGGSDAYLRSYAQAVISFGHPVILSFGHEMNGNWYSWGYGRAPAATFVAAWRHVVSVFRAAGAANVTWLWAVNSVNGASGNLSQWWPGAAWVNWTGIDGYYFRSTDTFRSVFGATIAKIRALSGAPLLIAETAVGTTANREAQIDGLFAGVSGQHLAGVVWFDEAQHSGLYHQDWRLENDAAARAAFTRAAAKYLGTGNSGA
jgi:mannan endo-1,4-beta-mannosidase